MIEVKRRAYTQCEAEQLYQSKESLPLTTREKIKNFVMNISIQNFLLNRILAFPRQLKGYKGRGQLWCFVIESANSHYIIVWIN